MLICTFIQFNMHDLLIQLGNHGSNLTEEELETHTIAAWKEGKLHHNRQINGNGRSYPRQLIHVSAIWDAICKYNSIKDKFFLLQLYYYCLLNRFDCILYSYGCRQNILVHKFQIERF